jgi:hypothetical protein
MIDPPRRWPAPPPLDLDAASVLLFEDAICERHALAFQCEIEGEL